MLFRPEGCNIRCPDARCRSKCRKIADWEREHAHELERYERPYPSPRPMPSLSSVERAELVLLRRFVEEVEMSSDMEDVRSAITRLRSA